MRSAIIAATLVSLTVSVHPLLAQNPVIMMNCGGGALTAASGDAYVADAPYGSSTAGYEGGKVLPAISTDFGSEVIGGPDSGVREVLMTSRVDWDAYRFDVPNGSYVVRLLVAEIHNQGVGLRFMNIAVEGTQVMTDFDIAEEFGVQYGGVVAVRVDVTDGRIDIVATDTAPPETDPDVTAPLLNGIEIWTHPATTPVPAAPASFDVVPSYHMNIVRWGDANYDVVAWEIERGDAMSGPFTPLATTSARPTRYLDETVAPGAPVFYRMRAVDALGQTGPWSLPVGAVALDSASSPLPVYELTMSAANLAQIANKILSDPKTEYPGTFTHAGGTMAAEVRYRGNSGRLFSKKSWKIKFVGNATFQGRTETNLKAAFIDPSMTREVLSARMFAAVGQPAQLLRHVHLKLNGRYLGIYTETEQIDERFLEARDRDDDGDLYKCGGNLHKLSQASEYDLFYERKTNGSDLSELIAFIDLINDTPEADFARTITEVLDVDAYLTYMAVIAWIGDVDSIARNFYLLRDADTGRWELLPYDADLSWGLSQSLAQLPLMAGTSESPWVPWYTNALRDRVLTNDTFRWRYMEKVRELIAITANATSQQAVIDGIFAMISVDGAVDPYKSSWESSSPFISEKQNLQAFVASRTILLEAELDALQPASPPTTLWINEIAPGATPHLDEAGDADDWVEIHNASGAPADVSGMYLTDDVSIPVKWAFPAGTVIPAFGYIVVTCDQEVTEGPLHATFKLKAGGEELALFASDGTTLIDYAAWRPMTEYTTWGRWEDARQIFRRLPTPTPGAANTTAGNLAPDVTALDHTPAVPSSTQSVAVSCRVVDDVAVTGVDLVWRVFPGAFQTTAMTTTGGDHWQATIPAHAAGSAIQYYVRATDSSGAITLDPANAPFTMEVYTVTDPVDIGLRISEILASNSSVIADETGAFEDYIEIHNTTGAAIDISGMYLTDNLANSTKWAIPPGTVVPAQGHVLVWADDEPLDGPLHATFKLSANGEEVALYDTDGLTLLAGFTFGGQSPDIALGTMKDADDNLFLLKDPSPGASNLPAPGAVVSFDAPDDDRNTVLHVSSTGASIGTVMTLSFDSQAANQAAVLFFTLDTFTADWGADGMQIVEFISEPGFVVGFTTDGQGDHEMNLLVPNIPALTGLTFFTQGYVATQGFSEGLAFTVGP